MDKDPKITAKFLLTVRPDAITLVQVTYDTPRWIQQSALLCPRMDTVGRWPVFSPMKKARNQVVTVQDIAREIGLSASSVSAVLSGQHVKRRIATKTVERVMAAARKLRYVPNVTARSLRAKDAATKHVVLSILTSYEAPVFLVTQALRALATLPPKG